MPERRRIFLIEDDLADATLIRTYLTTGGLAAEIMLDNRLDRAIQRIGQDGADLIISDLSLPDSKGVATIRSLLAAFPQIPVIVLTGNDDPQVAAILAAEGIRQYLVKSEISRSSLERAVSFALTQHQLGAVLGAVLAGVRDGVLLTDAKGMINGFNPAAERIFGLPREEALGRPAADLLTLPDLSELPAGEKQEHVVANPEGPKIPVYVSRHPVSQRGENCLIISFR